MPKTKKKNPEYWRTIALFGASLVFALLAGLSITAAAFLTSPAPSPAPAAATGTSPRETTAPSPFQNGHFEKMSEGIYWVTDGDSSYIYRQDSGTTSTMTLVSRYGILATHIEKALHGSDVFVAESSFETASMQGMDRFYFDPTTGYKIIEVARSSSTVAVGSYDPVLYLKAEADCEASVSSSSARVATGSLTGYRVTRGGWPVEKIAARSLLDAQDRVPVRCIASDDGTTYLEPADPAQPIFGQLQVSLTDHFGILPFGKTLLRLDFTQLEAPSDFVRPGYYTATDVRGKFQVRVPISITYDVATEGGPQVEQATGDVTDFMGFDTGPCWDGDCIPLSIESDPSQLKMSGAAFGKRSLALNRQYGVKDAVYSEDADTTFAGAPAFSFVATNVFEQRGGSWGEKGFQDDPKYYENATDSSSLSMPVRVIYFDHDGIFYRIIYAVGDTVAENILKTWQFTK